MFKLLSFCTLLYSFSLSLSEELFSSSELKINLVSAIDCDMLIVPSYNLYPHFEQKGNDGNE